AAARDGTAADGGRGRRRRQPQHHGGDGQSRRSHSGPGRAYAHRAADDPRMGRRPGRAKPRDQETAGADRAPAREELVANLNMLDHVTLGVSDFEQSKQFYDRALRPLGITYLYADGERAAGYGI